MSEAFLGEIRIFGFGFQPKGWAMCNGQLLPINQNQALFSLLGTTYGGDGRVTFGLPNMQGRVPLHFGGGFVQGQAGGEELHTLISQEMPQHTHLITASPDLPNTGSPANNYFATSTDNNYAASPDTAMSPQITDFKGGNQPHPNLSPFLVLNVCICLIGIFPSQN